MSNPDSKLFPVRFVRDGKNLQSDRRIQGTKCRASNKGAQPEDGQTWLCSWGFRPKNAPFRYVICKELAPFNLLADEQGKGGTTTEPTAQVASDLLAALEAQPKVLVLATTNHVGDLDPAVKALVKPNGKRRRNRGGRNRQAQGAQASAPAAVSAPAVASTESGKSVVTTAGNNSGNRSNQQRNSGRKSRDNRGARDGQTAKSWSSARPAADKRPAVIRCTIDSVVARAKVLVAPAPTGKVDLSDLRFAFSQKRAQVDGQATSIRALMQMVLGEVGSFQTDSRLWGAMAILNDLSLDGPKVAEALFQARKERDRLQAEQTALNTERLRALGKRGKALKDAGENADPAEKAALDALKAEFAERQAPLTDALKAVKLKIAGTKDRNYNDGLEHQLIDHIDPWWSNWQDALAKIDGVLKAMSDVSEIYDDREAILNTLIGLVYDYEKRLNQLG